jgi:hypothetical protein
MPNTTSATLDRAARLIHLRGLHRGDQFAAALQRLDVSAAIYLAAEGGPVPAEFFTNEVASLRLIEASADAMQAIRAVSDALDSEVCETEIAPGVIVPDYIEHVSNWAATPPIGEKFPPTTAEVIGRILRAADQATPNAA